MDSLETLSEHVSQSNVQPIKFFQMETVSVSQDIKETLKVFVLKVVDQMNFYQMINASVYQDSSETHSVFVFQSHVERTKFLSTTYANVDQDLLEHQLILVSLPHNAELIKSMINHLDHVSVDKVMVLTHQPDYVQYAQPTQDQVDYYQDVFVIQDILGVQFYKDV